MGVLTVCLPKGMPVPDWLTVLIESDYILHECKFAKYFGTSKFETKMCDVLPAWYCRPMVHIRGYPATQWWRSQLNLDTRPIIGDESAFSAKLSKPQSNCLFMGSLSFLGTGVTDTPKAIAIGIVLISLLFLLYSLAVFHYRRVAIGSKSIDGYYDDKWGPSLLVGTLFLYLVISLAFQITFVGPVPLTTVARANREIRIPLNIGYLE
eukprot:TRINITY_DN349_c0_g1_i10.p1 TRINITY_DN349_c0_g1~~TRINITY_DN349_c0_g1_i10.p1  ORF type:complete len:208 (-),score=38.39 TRINITY_DN349_c0_g1_i10:6682-7305(-)